MAAERQFQAAAHADRVDGGDHRFVGIFQRLDHAQQIRLLKRLGAAELADVGAARKGLAGPGEHDAAHRRVGGHALERVDGAVDHVLRQRVQPLG